MVVILAPGGWGAHGLVGVGVVTPGGVGVWGGGGGWALARHG